MTLSEIIALPDAELYAAFWIARGYEVRAFHDRFWPWCFVKNGEPISHHGYASKSDVLAHAPAPEPDVWLKVMDELLQSRTIEIILSKDLCVQVWCGLNGGECADCDDYANISLDDSAALMRAVLACFIYTHQPEQK